MSSTSKMIRAKSTMSIPAFKSPVGTATTLQIRRASAWSSSSLSHGPGFPKPSTTVQNKTNRDLTGLSVLPTQVLLRSLLVTTVSSNRALRVPSLSFLLFVTKAKGLLFNVDRNPFIRWILRKTLYDHFCAGETESQVRNTIQGIKDMGLRGVILTHAREASQGVQANAASDASVYCEIIQAWKESILQTVDLMGVGDYLAPKLTGAGPKVLHALSKNQSPPQQMVEALNEICDRVAQKKARLLMDAEQHVFLRGIHQLTLDLMRKYNQNGSVIVFNTYQAYLKGTPETLAAHMRQASTEGFALGVKLVRGAYMASDPRHLIHDAKEETDAAYDAIVHGILKKQYKEFGTARDFPSVELFLATHNKKSAVSAHHLHQARVGAQLPTVNVEYGQLMGMADSVSLGLLRLNGESGTAPGVYKCLHWGTMRECLGFLVRRAMENQDAVSRTKEEHSALNAEVKRRVRQFAWPYK